MISLNRFFLLGQTMRRLGWRNVAYIAWYRLTLIAGLRQRYLRAGSAYAAGELFRPTSPRTDYPAAWQAGLLQEADRIVAGELHYFSRHWMRVGSPPQWFFNPFTGKTNVLPLCHWTSTDEFALGSDIKIIWEPSRLAWALTLARAYAVSGKETYLNTLNSWISDWIRQNPLGLGPNWKCGQECAIRLLHVLTIAFLLRQHLQPSAGLIRFVTEHAQRISANIRYALAQDNNHATSEATALMVAGAWLQGVTTHGERLYRLAGKWQSRGRAWLERSVLRLVAEDGTFAQYSVNYHRLFLDTLSMALFWQRTLGLAPFGAPWMEKAYLAWDWLNQLVDPVSGAVPNLGGNDGALIWPLHGCDYRDFRPALQLAAALIHNRRKYATSSWDEPLYWLDLHPEPRALETDGGPAAQHFSHGGFIVLRSRCSWALLHYPQFRFRPAQADVMHLDLWHAGQNILRDAGSYSYNCEEPWQNYFAAVQAHNTAQFDDHDQMPRLGRFLYGAWLKPDMVGPLQQTANAVNWQGSYRDAWRCRHRRQISVVNDRWTITDQLQDYRNEAVLRWRLIPAVWQNKGLCFTSDHIMVTITGSPAPKVEMTTGWESRYYLDKTTVPVLEARCPAPQATLVTEIVFLSG